MGSLGEDPREENHEGFGNYCRAGEALKSTTGGGSINRIEISNLGEKKEKIAIDPPAGSESGPV